jgi:carboxylesterase type B
MFLQLLLTLGFAILHVECQQAPTVKVTNGTYSGRHDGTFNQDIFLGMPFAQPPIGSQRFKLPLSLNSTWTGTRPATTFGFDCPSYFLV